jgi:cbb3-type cytochrome oxidase subunit 3
MADGKLPADRETNPAEKAVEKYLEKTRHPARKIFLILITVILIASTVWIHISRYRNQRDLEAIKREYRELKSKNDTIKVIKSRRVEFFRIQSFLNSSPGIAFASAAFIRKLKTLDPEEVVLEELSLFPGNQNIIFHLNVILPGKGNTAPDKLAEAFCRQLESWEELFDISFLPKKSGEKRSPLTAMVVSGKIEVE